MSFKQASSTSLDRTDIWHKRGSVDESRIRALLLALCVALRTWHQQGGAHGEVSPSNIVLDKQGNLGFNEPTLVLATNKGPLFGVLPDGYAAFELYVQEEQWPIGAWTDIYGLCAIAYELMTGRTPQNAVRRLVDRIDPIFDDEVHSRYSVQFLNAVRRGLSLEPQARQQSLDELLLSFGLQPERAVQAVPTKEENEWTSQESPGRAELEPTPHEHAALTSSDSSSLEDSDAVITQPELSLFGKAGAVADHSSEPKGPVQPEHSTEPKGTEQIEQHPSERERSETSSGVTWRAPVLVGLLLAAGAWAWFAVQDQGASTSVAVLETSLSQDEATESNHGEAIISTQGEAATPTQVEATTPNYSGASTPNYSEVAASDYGEAPTPSDATDVLDAMNSNVMDVPSVVSDYAMAQADLGESATPDAMSNSANALAATDSQADRTLQSELTTGSQGQNNTTENAENSVAHRASNSAAQERATPNSNPALSESGGPDKPGTESRKSREPEKSAATSVSIAVDVRPWGEVFVDGVSRGVSPPMRTLSLQPGTYQIRITNGDLTPRQLVLNVKQGEPVGINHKFGEAD